MITEKVKLYGLIGLIACIIVLLVVISFKNSKITRLILKSDYYQGQYDNLEAELNTVRKSTTLLQVEIDSRNEAIDSILQLYNKTPKDEGFKNVSFLIGNDSWDEILRANEIADDSTIFQP
jgi:hypothetical protein